MIRRGSHPGGTLTTTSRLARGGSRGLDPASVSRPETEVGSTLDELRRSGNHTEGAHDEQDPFNERLHSFLHLLFLSGADPTPP
jgi:hypothetical protein